MKKIMFNDRYGLTDSVLSSKKTQTRRLVSNDIPLGNWEETEKHAHYKIGEVVAIAQAYKDIPKIAKTNFIDVDWERTAKNKLFGRWGCASRLPGWHNKMFVRADVMPNHIKITNIHIERLQDISDDDCLAEGIYRICDFWCFNDIKKDDFGHYKTPREAYAELIDKICGKGTWNSNPLVWVYDFELIK